MPLIADLRHKITFQAKARASDGGGGGAVTWGNVPGAIDIWAEVIPASAFKRQQSEQMQARISHRMTIRYRTGVNPAMRIVWDTRIFTIRGIMDEEERHKWLLIDVDEVKAA